LEQLSTRAAIIQEQATGKTGIRGASGEGAGIERAVVEEPGLGHLRQPRAVEAAQGPFRGPESKDRQADEIFQQRLRAVQILEERLGGALASPQMEVAMAGDFVPGLRDLANPSRQPLRDLAEHKKSRRAPCVVQLFQQLR